MTFSFDLISDLHIESWTKQIDWSCQPTAPYCVVAGDIARDRALVIDTLEQLGEAYSGVFYIDGNDEHKDHTDNLARSYKELNQLVEKIPNVIYMHDNVVIVNGVAFLATNGWWNYDFDPNMELDQSIAWYCDKAKIPEHTAIELNSFGYNDTAYMINSVKKLQLQSDVKGIVMITHTVPAPWLVQHDTDLVDTWRFNITGNHHIDRSLKEDRENKIKAWCFGHYHRPVDVTKNNIRYACNPRGRGDTEYSQAAYYPKRITIDV